jgi:hypothetical protein
MTKCLSPANLTQIKCDRTVAYDIELESGQGLVIVSRREYEFRQGDFRFADVVCRRAHGDGDEPAQHSSGADG